jgi:molybdopterin-guanine dinucleotide biosynthesis protein A
VQCVGVLLAGGAARRFGGEPKGLALLGGDRIADRVMDALLAATGEQLVVANDPRATGWFPGLRVERDRSPGLGPLAGIATALEAADERPILLVAWDMPFVTGALLRALQERGEGGASAVIPVHGPERRAEPLCAYYPHAALESCRALLAAGERRAGALFRALPGSLTMGDEELAGFGEPARLFTSVDSLDDLSSLGGTPPAG